MTVTPPPWYRQAWPWFLILLPASVVVASFYMLYLALSAPEAVVRDEYDKNGLDVTRRVEQDRYAARHAMSAELSFAAGSAVIRLAAPPSELPAALALHLVHPTDDEADSEVLLPAAGEGLYTAAIARPVGRRYLQLEAAGGESRWRLRGMIDAAGEGTARLLPGDD